MIAPRIFSAGDPRCPLADSSHIAGELLKARPVRIRFSANKQVNTWQDGQQVDSDELSQTSLHKIPLDNLPSVFGNDDAYPRMWQQGSGSPGFQSLGLHSLPCTSQCFQVSFTRQPDAAREAEGLRRQRTS